jgi:hypothetical protein
VRASSLVQTLQTTTKTGKAWHVSKLGIEVSALATHPAVVIILGAPS